MFAVFLLQSGSGGGVGAAAGAAGTSRESRCVLGAPRSDHHCALLGHQHAQSFCRGLRRQGVSSPCRILQTWQGIDCWSKCSFWNVLDNLELIHKQLCKVSELNQITKPYIEARWQVTKFSDPSNLLTVQNHRPHEGSKNSNKWLSLGKFNKVRFSNWKLVFHLFLFKVHFHLKLKCKG